MHKLHPFLCAINIANYMLEHFKDHIVLPNNYQIYNSSISQVPSRGAECTAGKQKQFSMSGPPISIVNNIILFLLQIISTYVKCISHARLQLRRKSEKVAKIVH